MPDASAPVGKVAKTADASVTCRIPLRLTKPHSLINQTIQEEEKRKQPDYYYARYVQTVDFSASKKQTQIALAILDRLFKALEAQNMEVVLDCPTYGRAGTFARKGRDSCPVRVEEIYQRVAHEATAKEKADKENSGCAPAKWDSIPTGEFTLSPGGKVDLHTEAGFAASLARTIAAVTEKIEQARISREERERRENEEARRQRLRREEEDRIKAFRESAQSLEHYRVLVQYIEEVRRHGVVPNNQRHEKQTLEEWLSWAESQARCFHPLS